MMEVQQGTSTSVELAGSKLRRCCAPILDVCGDDGGDGCAV